MGLVERQRVFLVWFVVEVQNCMLQIVVGSKSVLDSEMVTSMKKIPLSSYEK